ncbi:hypothetical protein ABW365_13460 [Enterococcus avium]
MVEQIKNSMKEKIKRLIELPYVLKFFLVFSSFFGVLMIKTIPPLQAPDEIGHYVKAEAFSDLKFVHEKSLQLLVKKEIQPGENMDLRSLLKFTK